MDLASHAPRLAQLATLMEDVRLAEHLNLYKLLWMMELATNLLFPTVKYIYQQILQFVLNAYKIMY